MFYKLCTSFLNKFQRPPTSIIEQLHKRVQLLERNDHRDIHEKWDIVSQKIANGESPRYLIEDAKNFKHHFVARIGMLQAELDTYIRLVDKQKGLNQMMSSRILQQTIMERDNSIKKELNWLGSWFGIGSSASLQQKLKFNGSEEDGEGIIQQQLFSNRLYTFLCFFIIYSNIIYILIF